MSLTHIYTAMYMTHHHPQATEESKGIFSSLFGSGKKAAHEAGDAVASAADNTTQAACDAQRKGEHAADETCKTAKRGARDAKDSAEHAAHEGAGIFDDFAEKMFGAAGEAAPVQDSKEEEAKRKVKEGAAEL